MGTIHAYTGDPDAALDGPQRKGDLRRSHRAAAVNIVPNSTGAAKAIGLVIPELNGKLIGAAQRVPTPTGSTTILNAVVKGAVTVDQVNAQMKAEATESFGYNTDEIVSSDIIGMRFGSLFDATQTMVLPARTAIPRFRSFPGTTTRTPTPADGPHHQVLLELGQFHNKPQQALPAAPVLPPSAAYTAGRWRGPVRPAGCSEFLRKFTANPQLLSRFSVGADASVRPVNASLLRKSTANPQHFRADRVVGPYGALCKFTAAHRAEQSPAPTNCIHFLAR